MSAKYLIVGQGLAGTTLAHQFLKAGKSIQIIQNSAAPSSSKVAGGMINPVTGKRLAKTWLLEELFSYLNIFYRELELILEAEFLFDLPLCRPFKNENQKSQFTKAVKSKDLQNLISVVEEDLRLNKVITNNLGSLRVEKCGRLDVPLFMERSKAYFVRKGIFLEGIFDYSDISFENGKAIYDKVSYDGIVFCEGSYVKNNPFFDWLPLKPVKGETLDVKLSGDLPKMIFNQGAWIMPMENDIWKFGSTYDWDNLDFIPTEEAKFEILEKVNKFLKVEKEVINQSAGIRPAVVDRRPIIGAHPVHQSLYIFNGLGTKGVSLAPYISDQFVQNLFFGKEIDSESTIERFYPLH